ncbi:MAG: DUF1587 domain-containing protein, partial [Planctomycetota bacterium]|nr:DUF1587 domain-containing protein [Planctomycetota bacterium]
MRNLFPHATAILLSVVAVADANESTQNFLKENCIRCHGSQTQKADRRFDDLPNVIQNLTDLERYQEIVDQLNLEEMPPEDEPQPTAGDRAKAIAQLTDMIGEAQARLKDSGGHSVLRRLNSWEYRHTIGDLLGLNVEAWNPTENFPAEVKVEGFDNVGAELVTSGMLLEHYFDAAEEAIRRATQFGDRPQTESFAQQSPFYFKNGSKTNLPKLFQIDRFRFIPDTPYTDMYGRHYRGGHLGFMPLLEQGGVTHSGI